MVTVPRVPDSGIEGARLEQYWLVSLVAVVSVLQVRERVVAPVAVILRLGRGG